ISRRTPSSRIAQTFARYGILCGGSSCRRPWRGRNATCVPSISPTTIGAEGFPYGVDRSISSTSARNEPKPEPPKIPITAFAEGQPSAGSCLGTRRGPSPPRGSCLGTRRGLALRGLVPGHLGLVFGHLGRRLRV